ncbi:MAG: efflux RND transporter permease subunit [Bacteroidales bacterium]|nr:efflux RND transporter permease subunit [Bacteroidales bacterium]
MSLFSSAVKKPITTALMFVAIAIFGIFSFITLPIDLFPHIEGNTIMVMTSYAGASASDIENNISKPIENTLNSVSYLKHISSASRENVSVVTLEFQYGRDIDVATNDVRDKLEMIKTALPDGAGNPVIFKFSSDDIPILILSVTAKESMPGLYKIMDEKIVNELARVNGVGSVSVSGIPKREIMVLCDPYKLDAYNLTIESISSTISSENRNIPAGSIEVGSNTFSMRVQKEFTGSKEIENLVVGSYNGANIYLKDVARVVDGLQERSQESYTNGEIGGMIIVQKQTGENSVRIVRKVNQLLPSLEKQLPSDIKLGVIVDTTENITRTIGSLEKTILITLFIVMLVVFFFLGRWRATIIILITIPISLLASLIYLYATGNTLNMISMSSLSIAIGMVVDAAIVVLENITSHIDRGSNPKQAAVYATNEVAMAVIASSLTTLAVFLPMTLVSGLAGIMFRQLGWMVSIVITVSTLCALALTPMMCSTMLRAQNKDKDTKWHKAIFTPINKFLDGLSSFYARLLDKSLRHKRVVVLIAALTLIGVFAVCGPMLKTEFVPEQDNGRISVTVQLPVGTRQEITRDLALELDKRWRAEFPEIIRLGLSEGSADSDNLFASMRSNGSHIISMNINLGSMENRKRSIKEISSIMMSELAEYNQIKRFNVIAGGQQGGMGGQATCQVDLYGYDFNATDEAAAKISEMFKELGVKQTVISRDDYVPEYQVDLDREKLALYGLNTATVATFLRNRINGAIASEYRESGDEYDIRVRYAPEYRQSLKDVENITVYSSTGQAIKLRELGTIVESMTPPTIQRKDRERFVSVSAPLPEGMATSDMNEAITAKIEEAGLPAGVSWKFGGTYDDQVQTFQTLGLLMVLIVILVFIVMAAQFESLTYPFVIMFAVPFAFVGVLIGLTLTGTPMSIMAMVGAVMTIGIVVNNGIVLVDYANLNRERGMGVIRAVVDSGRSRLRPVLMTTLTTVLGMLPLALGRGEGSEVWRGMGMTVAWGLSISTLVTLIFVPVLYTIFAAFGLNRKRKRKLKLANK